MNNSNWFYIFNGKPSGAVTLQELINKLPQLGGSKTYVFGPGMANWTEASNVPLLNPVSGLQPGSNVDVVDYQIFGSEMQYVEIILDPSEMVIAEPGAMMYMTSGIQMETLFGDPSAPQQTGFFDKLMAAGKRVLTGESLFISAFLNAGQVRETVAFAAPFPGKIIPMDLKLLGGELICQKDSFLCAVRGIQIGIAFQKRLGVGFFGGEGFIMQRLTGNGLALVHAGGMIMKRSLKVGETLRVDTGCLVALQPSVDFDIQFVKGIKNLLFGGEGMFFATLTGPGDIWLQSLPLSRLAGRLASAVGSDKEEGSIFGRLGGVLRG